MIGKIKITPLKEAKDIARGAIEGYTAWISTVGIEDEKDCFTIKRLLGRRKIPHFHRFFWDCEDHDKDVENYGPQKEDIEKIVEFLIGLKDSKKVHYLGINCYAGMCRSTAVGMMALVLQGYHPEDALDEILHLVPYAAPNVRMLRFFDEITGNETTKVVMRYRDWVNKGGIDLR